MRMIIDGKGRRFPRHRGWIDKAQQVSWITC